MSVKGIVIDAGHGGSDPGASGNGIIEKDLTLKISKYMYDRFRELGMPVALTRENDVTLEPTARANKALAAFGNDSDVIVISNHINAGGGDGAEVIYALRNTSALSNKILSEIENAGQNIRKNYQLRLPSDPSKDYYFILRDTPSTESIIVEYGFLDSTGDDVSQLKNNYKEYTEAVVKAVSEYAGIKYIPADTTNYYTVVKGDSLWSIANKYGITLEKLKDLNNLKSNVIQVGDVLKVSEEQTTPPSDYLVYRVQSGDSLWSIARKYDTTVNELIKLNNLSNTVLQINQQLYIPNKAEDALESTTYTVVSGDTLYGIARKFNVDLSELKSLNNLSTDTLSIGQVLNIPQNKEINEDINYVVEAGDNLYSIANKYGITVDDLKQANNLTDNIIVIGEVLTIPSTSNYMTYIVKSGDTLWDIARKYNTTVDRLKKINNLTTNLLKIGQKLQIPK